MYYDIYKTLSYNCLFNFIIGNRGGGKTYASKTWAIKDFLKTGSQFIYLRRYKPELKNISRFFDDIRQEFSDHELIVKNKDFYIDGKLAGTAKALSTAKIEKSNSFPLVNKIIFDEFILDKGTYHYLPDEVTAFLEFYETVARMRENVKVFFLSNALTQTNPYFLFFSLKVPYNSDIYRKGDMLLQLVADADFIEKKKETRFGKIIAGTKYAEYSIENSFLRDSRTFIEKKQGTANYYFTFVFADKFFGVWIDYTKGCIYVSKDIDTSCKIVYSLTLSDHSPNALLLKNLNRSVLFKNFIDSYKMGCMRFENMDIKNICYEVIKSCLS